MRLLVVEADSAIGEPLARALTEAAFAVEWVRDGEAAMAAISAGVSDLVLLDIDNERPCAHPILQALLTRPGATPLIVVTAGEALDDRVDVLDAGADDCLIKPFHAGEMLARIRAVLRRHTGHPGPMLSNGSLALDPVTRMVKCRDGALVRLSAREFAVLRALLARPGAVLSRKDIERRVYGSGAEVDSNAIEYFIGSLRRKLGAHAIHNVRGAGWRVEKS